MLVKHYKLSMNNYMVRALENHFSTVRFSVSVLPARWCGRVPFFQKATRYKMIPAGGGNPRTAGTFCPQAANTKLEHWTPQNATPLSFFRDRFY